MEIENHLFEIEDEKRVAVWDIVRYRVFTNLLWKGNGFKNVTKINRSKKLIQTVVNVMNFIWTIIHKKDFFFFLCSRNKQKETGKCFDQNAYDTLCLLPKDKCLINESFDNSSDFVYDGYANIKNTNLILSLFRKQTDFYDYTDILNVVKKYFPEINLTKEQLNSEYKRFWEEYRYYRFLFSRTGTKLIFVTQSRILKGLFYAARSLNLQTIEFNHGIVYDGHMAYSYPKGIKCKNYNANTIFSLSHFWYKDMYLPNTTVVPVGNTFFYPKVEIENSNLDPHSVLVVSSNEMGLLLKDFIINAIDEYPELRQFKFYFKLHPNQFNQKEVYGEFFKQYDNILVVTTEDSVPGYLSFCETLFTIQSTAAFEALQIGRKVIILKELSYETMQVLFKEPNIYVVDSPSSFMNSINREIHHGEFVYFEKFNRTVAVNAINESIKYK